MPISYTIDDEHRYIVETWTGMITAAYLGEFMRRFLADPVVTAIGRTVVDIRECRLLFSGEQLAELVENIVVPMMNGRKWISAIVVNDPIQFEITRQYHLLAESYSRDSIFGTLEDAIAWLQAQPT